MSPSWADTHSQSGPGASLTWSSHWLGILHGLVTVSKPEEPRPEEEAAEFWYGCCSWCCESGRRAAHPLTRLFHDTRVASYPSSPGEPRGTRSHARTQDGWAGCSCARCISHPLDLSQLLSHGGCKTPAPALAPPLGTRGLQVCSQVPVQLRRPRAQSGQPFLPGCCHSLRPPSGPCFFRLAPFTTPLLLPASRSTRARAPGQKPSSSPWPPRAPYLETASPLFSPFSAPHKPLPHRSLWAGLSLPSEQTLPPCPPEPWPGPHHCTPAVAPHRPPWVSGFIPEK